MSSWPPSRRSSIPELVVLGGGIGANADVLLPRLERAVARLTPAAPADRRSATLGADAIVLGAIATALETARDLVFTERAGDGRLVRRPRVET